MFSTTEILSELFWNLLYRFLRSVPFPHGVQESLSWLPAWPVPGLLTVTTDWGQDISSNLRIRGTRRRMRIRKTDDASIVFTSCATSCRSRKVNADRHLFNVELKENSSNEVKQQQQQAKAPGFRDKRFKTQPYSYSWSPGRMQQTTVTTHKIEAHDRKRVSRTKTTKICHCLLDNERIY